ncbi:MAG: AAA family ATPase [Candidatus Paceibacterota bacterium]|jgi:ATP-dependent exoDNAse (exonuclease V) alpha subunit
MTQREALDIMKTGKNVFITGPAGSGKTFAVNEYIKYLKDHDVPIGVTASTGIAATHMSGVTIHSWTGIGVRDRLTKDEVIEIGEKSYIKKKVAEAKVLIIDEVSMLHHFRLDMVNRVLKHIKKSEEPFGGLQVILCGDFFQLPPVARMGEPEARFIYNSESWKEAEFIVCYLHENFRQNNDSILSILNEIRSGEVSDGAREELGSRHHLRIARKRQEKGGDEISGSDSRSSEHVMVEPTRLYTHNIDVDSVNDRELAKVSEYEAVYEMISKGRKPLVEALKKSCLAPEFLRLKKGARVMCVKNNFDLGYVNGTLGVVISCGWNIDPVIRTAPTPDFPNGRTITIEKATWVIEDDGKTLAELNQYPLRLAWAITVHKSQGMSLDAIEVDLSRAFEPGMGYVALSRVRTLAGLTILGINENAFKVHPEVLEYDRHLRELSDKAERVIQYTDEKDIIQSQNEFLARVAPLHSLGPRGKKIKQPKPRKLSTFEKTALLVKAGKSLSEMAKERGMQEESIVGQIERLIEGGKGAGDGLQLSDIQYLKKEIPVQHFIKLEKALEEVSVKQGDDKPPFLGPVKSKVGFNISWKEIRLARVLLGYFKKVTLKGSSSA